MHKYATGLLYLLCLSPLLIQDCLADFSDNLVAAALERTRHHVIYDGRYQKIPYPGGDVSPTIGVCTDVVIRSYRKLGIDLQQLVHEDMRAHFDTYPSRRIWGLARPDANIDHRRVPNLQTFFTRHGQSLPTNQNAIDYQPGDLVTWMLPGNLPHIGIITDRKSRNGIPLVVHNIGMGPRLDNSLFNYPITGHYRFQPDVANALHSEPVSSIASSTSGSPSRKGNNVRP